MLALINGNIYTGDGRVVVGGTVLIEGEKIKAVGKRLRIPEGAEIVDLAGKNVYPGLIDAHCHAGLLEEIYRVEGDDLNEATDPITPHLRVIDGVNPEDLAFADALKAGVTAVCVLPGSANVVGGQGAVLRTHGRTVEEMLVKHPAGLKAAFGENPKRIHGGKNRMPATRMATAALLRELLVRAENYRRKKNKEKDLRLEALQPVLEGEIPLRVHAHRADDIMTAVRIGEEFGLKLVIEHGTEAHKIAPLLAEKNVPVVVGPVLVNRAKVEMKDLTPATAAVLWQAGVKFAFMTDHPVVPVHYLPLAAALACRAGLPEEAALAALTKNAAEILGIEQETGTLAPGKAADLVITSGNIFDLKTKIDAVYLRGKQVFAAKNDEKGRN
ncbi:MAG: hypothetical protein PWQ91_974 [Eubacteriales bacterium]|nr:hypothetical protein [Eubacteriales bacterium]MDN5363913.1 hypothetical protein [Eubacteriales bacterium]